MSKPLNSEEFDLEMVGLGRSKYPILLYNLFKDMSRRSLSNYNDDLRQKLGVTGGKLNRLDNFKSKVPMDP